MTEQSIDQNIKPLQIVLKHATTPEYQTLETKETWLLSDKGEKAEKKIYIANSLLARDFKGFGNQETNGVIEKWI